MDSKKKWHEKVGIWVGIIAGVCTILGINLFGNNSSGKNNESYNAEINYKDNKIGDDNPDIIGDNNIINYVSFQNINSNNVIVENQYNLTPYIVEMPSEEFIAEPYDIDKLENAFFWR